MNHSSFRPFYDRMADRLGISSVGKALVSLFLGLAFFVARFLSVEGTIYRDWSWMLGVLISLSMLFLYYATDTLRNLFPRMDLRLRRTSNETYLKPLKRTVSDGNFIRAGIFFGALNCLMGYLFGAANEDLPNIISIFSGFFVVGFICGMAALGIYGVLVTMKAFTSKGKLNLDYTEPDRCGGTLFLGEALVKFSLVTLIMGVMICVYILNAFEVQSGLVRGLMWFWIIWPFLLSMAVLLAPSAEINRVLREYKVEEEERMQRDLAELRTRIEDSSPGTSEALRGDYGHRRKLRAELHVMRTWPFNVGSAAKYVAGFLGNAVWVMMQPNAIKLVQRLGQT